MWIVGYQNFSYISQDTNAAIETYHSYMEFILKSEEKLNDGPKGGLMHPGSYK